MRVVAADSGAALLDEHLEPLEIVASAGVLVGEPYRFADFVLSEAVWVDVGEGYGVIPRELELCRRVLERVGGDVVHLDLSLGGASVAELTASRLVELGVPAKTRQYIVGILPRLRKLALEIKSGYGVEVLALGKESIPVRIAELTCGAQAIIYAAGRCIEEGKPLMIGLPSRCAPVIGQGCVYVKSLIPCEHDVYGYAVDVEGVLNSVSLVDMPNPVVRGFRMVKISPK